MKKIKDIYQPLVFIFQISIFIKVKYYMYPL